MSEFLDRELSHFISFSLKQDKKGRQRFKVFTSPKLILPEERPTKESVQNFPRVEKHQIGRRFAHLF